MRRSVLPAFIFLFLLAACAALEPDRKEVEGPATTPTAPPPAGPGVVTVDEETGALRGRPLDPQTLADLPGHDAVDFGHHFTYALSPDGRTMALIAWPSGSHSQGGALRIVDLPLWTVTETGVTVDGHVSSLHFSPGGRFLYWAKADLRDTAHAVPRDYRVYRYWLDGAQPTAVAELPSAFMPQEMRLLPDGGRLAIYGIPVDANYLAEGPPRVLLVDLATGETAADVALEGVTAGQFPVEVGTEGDTPYRMVQPALAWDVGRSLLYVVHGDENRVTVVDLAAGRVQRQADVQRPASLLERLVGWGARTAEAKILPSVEKQAALSPDGRRLYVTGLHREMRPDWNEQGWPYDETPLGLQVIDAATLAEVGRLERPVTELALSPDGRWLLLAGAYNAADTGGRVERVAPGVYVVDAESLEETAHFWPGKEVYLRGFSRDGRHAYVSTATSDFLNGRHTNWQTTLHVVDLEAGTPAAGREFSGSFLDLISGPE